MGKGVGAAAHEQKQINYYDPAAESREDGWRPIMYPAEVESWGFSTEHSTKKLWKSSLRRRIVDVAEEATQELGLNDTSALAGVIVENLCHCFGLKE